MKDADAVGLLLYPQSGVPICVNYDLSGRKVRVRTLDLAQPCKKVHQTRCDLVAGVNRRMITTNPSLCNRASSMPRSDSNEFFVNQRSLVGCDVVLQS